MFTVGAVYATVTDLPFPIAEANVSTIDRRPVVLFGPMAVAETVIGLPSDSTAKLPAVGNDVTCNFSSYVSVMFSPLVATDPVEYTGLV